MTKFFYSQLDYSAALNGIDYEKPQVKAAFMEVPVAGERCTVVPINHPATYLNGHITYTSAVITVDTVAGSFETRNTIYVKDNSLDNIEACPL